MDKVMQFKRLQPLYQRIIEILQYRSYKNDLKSIEKYLIDAEQRRKEYGISKGDVNALRRWAILQINNPDYY